MTKLERQTIAAVKRLQKALVSERRYPPGSSRNWAALEKAHKAADDLAWLYGLDDEAKTEE